MHLRWLVYLRCTVIRDEVHRIGFLIVTWLHCTENHIFFFQTSWKDGFSKKSRWILKIWFSLYYQERWFFFPENMILAPDGKWKMVFLKKIDRNQKYDIFFKCFEKMLFSKRIAPGYDLSCTIWKGGVFFSQKLGIFSLDGKQERDDLSQEIHGNMIYSIWYVPCPLANKNQRRSYPAKIDLKLIGVPDQHPRKSSSNSLYLHGDLTGVFIRCSPSKKTGNLIYRIEVWRFLQFIWLEILCNE